ncbi:MAG: hypothetical protein RSD95_16165 [Clostridia bacterium]
MQIDTQVKRVTVEIEGNHYEVEPKTVAVAQRLQKAAQSAEGVKAQYQLWIDHLTILLGKAAVKRLFPAGKSENLDRMEMIYTGVMEAFNDGAREARDARNARVMTAVEDMKKQLAPMCELLSELSEKYRLIERPEQT